jgi:hypothetical protein
MSVKNIYASNETSQKFSLKSIWLFLETTLNWMTLKYGCKAETWCYHKIWKIALFFTKKKHTYKFQIPLTFFALCYSYKGSALYYCLYSLCRQARDFARSLSKEGKGHRCCGHERCFLSLPAAASIIIISTSLRLLLAGRRRRRKVAASGICYILCAKCPPPPPRQVVAASREWPPPPHQTATASAATASNRACSSCKLQAFSIRYAVHTTT